MPHKLVKSKLLSILLTAALLLLFIPAAAFASAAAVGMASGTAGYSQISVDLSAGEFAEGVANVTNAGNWQLNASGGQTITGITKFSATSIRIYLSHNIDKEDTFTLQALAIVFKEGTEPFAAPINVIVYVPQQAEGNATATAGMKDITVALGRGAFADAQYADDWVLGGASAAENSIAGVTSSDPSHAKITLTNNIKASDTYTITALQSVFVNIMTAPFTSPLPVEISVPADNVCELSDGRKFTALDAALSAAEDGQTITLLTDITHNSGITIENKTVIFNLAGHNLNVTNNSGTGIEVRNGGNLQQLGTSGRFNVTGMIYGVKASGGGSSISINGDVSTSDINDSIGAVATQGADINIIGDVTAATYALYATDLHSTITAKNVTAINHPGGSGAGAFNQAEIFILGNVTADAPNSSGVYVESNGKITIDGTITSIKYINIMGTIKDGSVDSRAIPSTKLGYYTYSTENGVVWVKESSPTGVCEISGVTYPTIDAALSSVAEGQGAAIKLLTDITYEGELIIDSKAITFILGSNNLIVDNSGNAGSGSGLVVSNGGSVSIEGSGIFTVLGTQYGVRVYGSGSSATVTGATAAAERGIAVYSSGEDTYITVRGRVTASGADGLGVSTTAGTIYVTGNVEAAMTGGRGIEAYSCGSVEVTGDVTADFIAVLAHDRSRVSVTGDVTVSSDNSIGIYAYDKGDVSIAGNVSAAGINSTGIYARSGEIGNSTINVSNNVSASGTSCTGIKVSSGTARVSGSVTVSSDGSIGVYATDNSSVEIGRELSQVGDGIASGGVYCGESEVTVDGEINTENASNYIHIGEGWRAKNTIGFGVPDPSKPGYIKYMVPSEDETAIVWVGNGNAEPGTSPSMPQSLTVVSGNGQIKLTWTAPANDGGRTITGYEVSKDNGASWVAVNTGTSYTFTGLTNGAAYTFKVRAVNSFGYGAEASIAAVPKSSGGNVGGGGGSYSSPAPKLAAEILDSKGKISSTCNVSMNNSKGIAAVEVTPAQLTDAFNRSVADEYGVRTIKLVVPQISGTRAYTFILPLSFLASGDASKTIDINTPLAHINVPCNMLSLDAASGTQAVTLTIGAGDISRLVPELQAQIDSRPILELSLSLDGRQIFQGNKNAPAAIAMPFAPTAHELAHPESIIIRYIDGSGNLICVPKGHYDAAAGMITFNTARFSCYVSGFNQVHFKDVAAGSWYAKAVEFIAARGITSGTGRNSFSPETSLTRGQFIVMLMRACDITPDNNPTDNFADAGSTYYTGYLAAAKRLGISTGVGNNLFAPEKEITRQEMFTLLYNTLSTIGSLPQESSGKFLSDFNDSSDIAPWAKEAMTRLVETGTLGGSGDKLLPADTTTRAELAQVLYNLLSK